MDEIEDKLPKEFIEAFNNGYEFSKAFPEVGQSILEQNKTTDEPSPFNGLFGGMKEGINTERVLVNERYKELEDIEKQNSNKGNEIDR